MAADFKSHVLMRDEKGFVGIPFKRLILAAVSGGITYSILRIAVPEWSIPIGISLAVIMLVMTGMRGGLPLWQRLLYHVRGSLLLAASHDSQGLFGKIARLLDLPVELVKLDAATVFVTAQSQYTIDMREWVTFARAAEADADDGLVFVDAPMVEGVDWCPLPEPS